MSKLTDIKYRIDQLDGGAFQNLCDAYLNCRGYGTGYSLGMNTGTDKTAKGNPDTYFLTTNDKYVFVMYTTQKANFYQKALEDLQKCFDKGRTGLSPDDVAEIVYCYTYGRLSAGEHQCLTKFCADRDTALTLIGLDELGSDLYFKYPRLAKDFLGISVDTGQIMSIEEFVRTHDANQVSAPLNTTFLCREEELKAAMEKLEESNVLVISGPAGTGKTRLALKLCEDYSKEKGLEVLCVKSNGLELYEDLITELESETDYLVFVDDANELSGLHFVLNYLPQAAFGQKCIRKIVVTVRNYARRQVVKQILEVEKPEILIIELFKDENIKKLMESAYGITNPIYLNRITAIAEGNARLAMLAGKLAAETEALESIRDASELYDNYYGKQTDTISISETGIASAGIIAFFQALHLSHLEYLNPIFAAANITEDQFIADLKQLHSVELVDLCQDMAVRISDQSFSNYLIKFAFIDKKVIPLNQMIENGFYVNKERTISACNILSNVFSDKNVQEYMEQQINLVWDRLADDTARFPAFFEAFHMIRPTETLLLLKDRIEHEPARSYNICAIKLKKGEEISISDDVIGTICSFRLHAQLPEAIDLLLLYYQKRPDLFEQVYTAFTSEFGVNKDSIRSGYFTQKTLADRLCTAIEENPTESYFLLFVKVAEQFLHLSFSKSESGRRNTFTFYTMPLTAEESVIYYRNRLINHLYEIYKSGCCQKEIESLLMDYCERGGEEIEYEIVSREMESILLFFSLFSTDNLYHCVIAENIQNAAQLAGYDCGNTLTPFLEAQKYRIYFALKSHRRDWDDRDFHSQEKRHRARVQKLVCHYDLTDFRYMIDVCNECRQSVDREARQLLHGLEYAFDSISENEELFVEAVKVYIAADTPYDLHADIILQHLFKIMTPEEVKALLTAYDYSQKNTWLWYFYAELPDAQISGEWANDLLLYLRNPSDSIRSSPYRPLDCIKKYEYADENIIIKASRIIAEQYETFPFIFSLYFFFTVNSQREEVDIVIHQYENDISLLEDIYLKYLVYSKNEDYKGELLAQIIKNDPSFLDSYIDIGLERELQYASAYDDWGRRLSFLWKDEDYLQFMSRISDYIFEKAQGKRRLYSSLISQLLICEKEINAKNQDEWIEHTIKQHYQDERRMYVLFSAIADHGPDRRRNALKKFLELNSDYEIFEKLPLEAPSWGGWGSMIPYMQQRIAYLSSLLPLLAGLKFLKHKQKIIKDIEIWKSWIKREEIEELLTS